MFHVLFYVRPLAFPRWAIRVIRTFRIFRIFQAFRVFQVFQAFRVFQVFQAFRFIWFFRFIRTMLRAAIWHEKLF